MIDMVRRERLPFGKPIEQETIRGRVPRDHGAVQGLRYTFGQRNGVDQQVTPGINREKSARMILSYLPGMHRSAFREMKARVLHHRLVEKCH